MDEAISALDYETERKVCDNLLENLNDRTVFFITHRLSTIRNADVIVMLDKGAVVELGTHDELMDHRGRYLPLPPAGRRRLRNSTLFSATTMPPVWNSSRAVFRT